MVLQRQYPKPEIRKLDRVFWVFYSSLVKGWKDVVQFVQVSTVTLIQEVLKKAETTTDSSF
jgi:hypothetical protein